MPSRGHRKRKNRPRRRGRSSSPVREVPSSPGQQWSRLDLEEKVESWVVANITHNMDPEDIQALLEREKKTNCWMMEVEKLLQQEIKRRLDHMMREEFLLIEELEHNYGTERDLYDGPDWSSVIDRQV